MKRAGFTMIELIFVIVILGILASVAVPKLLGVKNSAEEGIVKSFVGSLNTTVAPAKWSQSLMDGADGVLRLGDGTDATIYDITAADTDFPSGSVTSLVDVSNCVSFTTAKATAAALTITVGTKTLLVVCRDGDSSNAPKFWYTEKAIADIGNFDDTIMKL